MKLNKTLIASSVAAVMAAGVMAPAQAEVEIGASVGVASTYLWRGYDLGSGTPAVSGDLNLSAGGFYGGIWGSSGDTTAGTEYDLYAGYGHSFGDFSIDVSVWNYNYPTGDSEVDFGDLSDGVVSLGYGPVAFTIYKPITGTPDSDYVYYTLGADVGAFSILAGVHDDGGCPEDETDPDASCSPAHLNVSYAYNDNLSFTFSQFFADESINDDLKFVVSYTLPLGE
ncbi:MAG TPA: TorF family putative porin [Marinagarivorans sp.]